MSPPVFVYYELANYYQNHRRYVKSRSSLQLLGEQPTLVSYCVHVVSPNCENKMIPLEETSINGNTLDLNPCGLIANSMFNGKWKG
ncbi:unnamed protein product [Laminaria digitata]